MGREIRRVPPNWEHPRWTEEDARRCELIGQLRPCDDIDYPTACAKWKEQFAEWENKGPIRRMKDGTLWKGEFWESYPTPDEDTCRPVFTEEPTWWQVYETVSEGTPISPAFATKEELIEYLVENGDEWAQRRGTSPPSRAAVEAFVEGGWAPSMLVNTERGVIAEGIDAMDPDL